MEIKHLQSGRVPLRSNWKIERLRTGEEGKLSHTQQPFEWGITGADHLVRDCYRLGI